MKAAMNITAVLFLALLVTSCNQKPQESTDSNSDMMETKMRESSKNRFKAWNTGDTDLMLSTLSDDFKRYSNGQLQFEGKDGYVALIEQYRTAFADINFAYEMVAISGNKTFTKWTASGTNTGIFKGQEATNNMTSSDGFTITTYNDEGLAIMEEAYLDELLILSNLGYNIKPPSAD
ncbi:ester cyclase [Nonlabens antarcticus]|uniref:ester cyclase n=1 Tax=Nonlabens antarcticus TaxID=392714 RepID=UPI001890B7D8|nr:ester cyclase [Nonlabens antarcticus]